VTQTPWPTDDVDDSTPNVARIYDYLLGGFHNFAADRDLAEQTIAVWPQIRDTARVNRMFLGRAVAHLAACGVRQYLDLGSGVPTVGNVHEIAQRVAPDSRVVYVDIEPVAVAHSQHILRNNANADVVHADLLQAPDVLAAPQVKRLLDPAVPTALLMVAVLHFVPDTSAVTAAIRTYREALGPNSWVAISHGTDEVVSPQISNHISPLYQRTASPLVSRSRAELAALLDGYEMIDPGLVLVEQWRPGSAADAEDPARYPVWAGIGCAR
jgi:hypothetical protein